jgi:flavin-dependent dehydrogenase
LAVAKDNRHFPVIIIGGGPAGLATSLTLSARRVHHCLADANALPVPKPGEAIPPNARPLLRQLGIHHLLNDNRHLPYYGNKACWGDDSLRQEEFITEVHGHGYLLDRLLFEAQLRELSASPYCTPRWGHKLRSVKEVDSLTTVQLESREESLQLQCEYVVDATGRKASVCRHLGVQKTTLDDQFALAVRVLQRTTMEQQIHIEAVSNGWWYAAPVDSAVINLMFFTSKAIIPPKAGLGEFLEQQLRQTAHLQHMIKNSDLSAADISMAPAGTSCLDIPYGENWLAVGDAAYAYDPISSYGITSGLGAGYYAGHALADTLAAKEGAFDVYRYLMENAFQAYLEKLEWHYALEQRWPESEYWRKRVARGSLVQ